MAKQAEGADRCPRSGHLLKGAVCLLYAYLSGKYDQAISFFRDIIKIEPNHFYTLLRIGDAYQQERNYPEAIKFHKRARKLDDKNLEAPFALANDYVLSGS
ncbi:MAG: tetratricopeptide repeat protein [Nitrospirae bacterium]|nr:tetratricopeptide repeat protein [Nitrospirota bacterium]